jgi:hypothetical protein
MPSQGAKYAPPTLARLAAAIPSISPAWLDLPRSGVDCRVSERRLRTRLAAAMRKSDVQDRWITRIADGQTIAYSVSADEVSMSLSVVLRYRWRLGL